MISFFLSGIDSPSDVGVVFGSLPFSDTRLIFFLSHPRLNS